MQKNMSITTLMLLIITTVYSFSSMATAFFMLGTKSLAWFFISALCYFIPYALIVAQYSKKYAHQKGTIYDWLKDSFSPKVAFITAFLWYCSYFTWMVSLFMKLMIPLSILLFGSDMTGKMNWFNWPTQVWLAFLAILAVLCLTYLLSRGFKTILSFLKISSLAMVALLLLSLLSNLTLLVLQPANFIPNLVKSWQAPSFFAGTYDQFFSQLPFFIFAITAFGGLDTVASLADKTKESRKKFPQAVIFSAGIIALLYILGIILWSGTNDITALRQTNQMHLGNLMYGLTGSLAKSLAQAFGFNYWQTNLLYQFYIRYTAFTLLTAYLGLLSSITYGPLKSLITGTPKEIWPKSFIKLNHKQMPDNALWLQAGVISIFIAALSFNNQIIGNLFNQLTYMTNVSRALPYFVVAASFPFFIRKNIVGQEELLISDKRVNHLLSISVCLCVAVAIFFQVYEPLKAGEYNNVLTLILGPGLFALLAAKLYQRFERSQPI